MLGMGVACFVAFIFQSIRNLATDIQDHRPQCANIDLGLILSIKIADSNGIPK